MCVVSLSKTATFSARNKSMIAPPKWLPGMIRQVPGKTNEIIGPEITLGRSVAFRHRDSRTGRGFRNAASDGQTHAGINAATELGVDRCPELAGQTDVVVDVSPRTTGVTVLFDGAKRSTCLHRDFISLIAGNGSWLR